MDNYWIVYPGQPFIGEGIINTILSCDNDPAEAPKPSQRERENSQIAFAMNMIALESLIQTRLNTLRAFGSEKVEELAEKTLDKTNRLKDIIILWNELRIIRNTIIHSGYFEKSAPQNHISKATIKRLITNYNSNFLDQEEEVTKSWRLCYNPLNITRYEAIVSLTFFYWYGKETKTWVSNVPINSALVDCRLVKRLRNKWLTISDLHHIVGHGDDFQLLVGFLSNRLPKSQRILYYKQMQDILGLKVENIYNKSKMLLELYSNDKKNG